MTQDAAMNRRDPPPPPTTPPREPSREPLRPAPFDALPRPKPRRKRSKASFFSQPSKAKTAAAASLASIATPCMFATNGGPGSEPDSSDPSQPSRNSDATTDSESGDRDISVMCALASSGADDGPNPDSWPGLKHAKKIAELYAMVAACSVAVPHWVRQYINTLEWHLLRFLKSLPRESQLTHEVRWRYHMMRYGPKMEYLILKMKAKEGKLKDWATDLTTRLAPVRNLLPDPLRGIQGLGPFATDG